MRCPDNITILRGAKPLNLLLPDEIPMLDEEQIAAGEAMFDAGNKLLFSDPGAGKTLTAIQALMLVEEHMSANPDPVKVLIVCPSIAVRTWMVWLARSYAEMNLPCVIQNIDKGNRAVTPETTHLIVTYGMLSRKNDKLMQQLLDFDASVFIADESDNLSGTDAARTKRVFGESFNDTGLISGCAWSWFLTGTPIPRYNDGLFPVLRAKFNDRLEYFLYNTEINGRTYIPSGDVKADYEFAFCRTELVKFGKMWNAKERICGNRHMEWLHKLLYGGATPIAIRNKLKMRDKPVFKEVSLDVEFSKEFLELEEEAMGTADFYDGARIMDPKLNSALRQMGMEMVPAVTGLLLDYIQKVNGGILVLFWHTDVGLDIAGALEYAGFKVGFIDGGTTQKNDAEVEASFNAGKLDFVVGQIASMGVALNMQENCQTVVFAEDTYSDAKNMQAYQRVWRRGQKKPVTVIYCRCYSPLAEIRPSVANRKGREAKITLDGEN